MEDGKEKLRTPQRQLEAFRFLFRLWNKPTKDQQGHGKQRPAAQRTHLSGARGAPSRTMHGGTAALMCLEALKPHKVSPSTMVGVIRKIPRKIPESQKWNHVILSHPWAKEIEKYFKLSENEDMPSHNWWGKAKLVLEGNMSLNASITKEVRPQINTMLPP